MQSLVQFLVHQRTLGPPRQAPHSLINSHQVTPSARLVGCLHCQVSSPVQPTTQPMPSVLLLLPVPLPEHPAGHKASVQREQPTYQQTSSHTTTLAVLPQACTPEARTHMLEVLPHTCMLMCSQPPTN